MTGIVNLSSHLITASGADQALYEVPNAGMLVLQDVINASWSLANTKADTAAGRLGLARDALDALIATPGALHVTASAVTSGEVVEPDVTIPSTITPGTIYTEFGTQSLALITTLVDKFAEFKLAHFPTESNMYEWAENWIKEALYNPSSAIPWSVQSQILGDDQARILADSARASDAVIATFAARRFPLPPGAAAGAVLQIQQKAQDEIAESSRKISILSLEQMKFAIEKAINLRTVALGSAGDYIKTLAVGPEVASRLVGTGYDAQSKLISSASQFYNSRIAATEVVNKVAQFNSASSLDAATKNQSADISLIEDKIKVLMGETQSLAQMATALFNNLHASVGLSTSGGSSISGTPA